MCPDVINDVTSEQKSKAAYAFLHNIRHIQLNKQIIDLIFLHHLAQLISKYFDLLINTYHIFHCEKFFSHGRFVL